MAGGAITASLRDYGLDDHFIKGASEWVRPNTSALFLLVKEANAEQVREKLRPFQATVLSTTLAPEQEQRPRKVLQEEEFGTWRRGLGRSWTPTGAGTSAVQSSIGACTGDERVRTRVSSIQSPTAPQSTGPLALSAL